MSVQPDFTKGAERPTMDAHALRNYLNEFVLQNAGSRDVEHRWLASYAADLMVQAFNVKAGNHNTIRKQVEEFRLQEIAAEKAKLREKIEVLDTEEEKALRAIETAAVST